MLRYATEPDVRHLDAQKAVQLHALARLPAAQQPQWQDEAALTTAMGRLAVLPSLVDQREIRALRQLFSRVELGAALLLHVGECAETLAMADPQHVDRRIALYTAMADHLAAATGREVVLVTRMAGQHAKPRSDPLEALPDGSKVPSYRGDAVNSLSPDAQARRPDPSRLLDSYRMSHATLEQLRGRRYAGHPVFVSHEALLRAYEEPLTRLDDGGPSWGQSTNAHYVWAQLHSFSAHLVWIGERTRQLGHWHVQWAASIGNPIGLKVGPSASPDDMYGLIRTLNTRREHGRLSLILRLGAATAADRLDSLAGAVVASRSPVLWQCDPMHGNTRKLGRRKVRLLPEIRAEVTAFVRTLRAVGCHPGGLHLEVTPENVRECHEDMSSAAVDGFGCHPPCDPRLSPEQAMEIVDHFAAEIRS